MRLVYIILICKHVFDICKYGQFDIINVSKHLIDQLEKKIL